MLTDINLSEEWNNSDQVLLVEEKSLHVHRCLLSLWSPVFDRMFNSEFIEKRSDSVTLHGKKYDQIKEMLSVMYDRRKEITEANIDFLLKLADEYQMEQLRTECIKHIKTANKQGLNAIKYYSLIRQYDLKEMEDICLKEIVHMSNETITNSNEYEKLDDKSKLDIITNRSKHLEEHLDTYKKVLTPIVEYMFNRTHDGFVDYLRDKDLDETIFTKCDRRDHHRTQRLGQFFDYTCELCRKRVTTATQFKLQTKDICEKMEQLYELLSSSPLTSTPKEVDSEM